MAHYRGLLLPSQTPAGTAPTGQLRKRRDKPSVIAEQTHKPPYLFFCLGSRTGRRQVAIAAVLSTRGRTCPLPKWHPKYRLANCTLPRVSRKPHLPQGLEYCRHMPQMLSPAVNMDYDIVQIGCSKCSMRAQHSVQKALKYGWSPEYPRRKRPELV